MLYSILLGTVASRNLMHLFGFEMSTPGPYFIHVTNIPKTNNI